MKIRFQICWIFCCLRQSVRSTVASLKLGTLCSWDCPWSSCLYFLGLQACASLPVVNMIVRHVFILKLQVFFLTLSSLRALTILCILINYYILYLSWLLMMLVFVMCWCIILLHTIYNIFVFAKDIHNNVTAFYTIFTYSFVR